MRIGIRFTNAILAIAVGLTFWRPPIDRGGSAVAQTPRAAGRASGGPVRREAAALAKADAGARERLAQLVDLDYEKVPLKDVLEDIRTRFGVEYTVNPKALAEKDIVLTRPVSLKLDAVPLEVGLELMLRERWLGFSLRGGVLFVSSMRGLRDDLEYRDYRVKVRREAANELVEAIMITVEPGTWDRNGGKARIEIRKGALVVLQSAGGHAQIRRLLANLSASGAIESQANRDGTENAQDSVLGGNGPNDRALAESASRAEEEVNAGARARLAQVVDLRFDKIPLQEVLDQVRGTFGAQCHLDPRSFSDEDASLTTPISFERNGIPLENGLDLILSELGLEYRLRHGVLIVSRKPDLEYWLETRVYSVDSRKSSAKKLITLMERSVDPDSWSDRGGDANASRCNNAIVICQTVENHERIRRRFANVLEGGATPLEADLLETSTAWRSDASGFRVVGDPIWSDAAALAEAEANARVRARLAQVADFDFDKVALQGMLEYVRTTFGVQYYLEQSALAEAGVDLSAKVSLKLDAIPLGMALGLMLNEHGLGCGLHRGVLIVSSKSTFDYRLELQVYPVEAGQKTAKEVAAVLVEHVVPDSWEIAGGDALIAIYKSSIVVSQTAENHDEFSRLLADLVAAGATRRRASSPAVEPE